MSLIFIESLGENMNIECYHNITNILPIESSTGNQPETTTKKRKITKRSIWSINEDERLLNGIRLCNGEPKKNASLWRNISNLFFQDTNPQRSPNSCYERYRNYWKKRGITIKFIKSKIGNIKIQKVEKKKRLMIIENQKENIRVLEILMVESFIDKYNEKQIKKNLENQIEEFNQSQQKIAVDVIEKNILTNQFVPPAIQNQPKKDFVNTVSQTILPDSFLSENIEENKWLTLNLDSELQDI